MSSSFAKKENYNVCKKLNYGTTLYPCFSSLAPDYLSNIGFMDRPEFDSTNDTVH
jgi:hypothetical protein